VTPGRLLREHRRGIRRRPGHADRPIRERLLAQAAESSLFDFATMRGRINDALTNRRSRTFLRGLSFTA
jgi:hypothetical protein